MNVKENNVAQKLSSLQIDLSGLQVEDIEVFFQEGSKGMPAFAASSSGTNCSAANGCSSKVAGT